MKDTVSIAIATYNGEKYLRDQLDSLYSQTIIPDEIIVVDDCSNDATKDILEEYNAKKGLRYIINENNLGVNKNFEKAIRSCKSEYIMICDQDDIWMPHKIETSLNKIKALEKNFKGPVCVSSQCYHIDANGEIISRVRKIRKDNYSIYDNILSPPGLTQGCTLIFNRKLFDILRNFPSEKICLYDGYIGFVSASVGFKYNMAESLMYHRHHNSNVTASLTNTKTKALYKLSQYKYQLKQCFVPSIIPKQRFKTLELIYSEYSSIFTDEAKSLYQELNEFEKSNFSQKIYILWHFKSLSIVKKICCTISQFF